MRFLTIYLLSWFAFFSIAGAEKSGRTEPDIEFAKVDGHSLMLDLYLPVASTKTPPLVVWIHGGGWRGGSRKKCEISWLVDHGYAVASVSYRLTDQAIFPAQIHDCKGAVRWLRAHAGKYGYDPEKIVVAGSSAGGHLAALLGTTGNVAELEGTVGGNLDQSSRVLGIIDYYGATDFIQRTKSQPHKTIQEGSIVRLLLGGPADEKVDLARLASSAFHVTPNDPPLLIFHGKKDDKVLLAQSERIRNSYRESGLSAELHVLETAGHGGRVFYEGKQRGRVIAFLDTIFASQSESTELFNGTTLEGWHKQSEPGLHGTGGHWGVTEEGVLFGEQDPPGSGNGGLLLSDQSFGDFEMELSLHPDWGPCSGIFLRANERGEGWQVYVDYHDNGNVGHLRLESKVHSVAFRPFAISRIQEDAPKLKVVPDARTANWPEGVYEESCSGEEFLAAWNAGDWNRMKIRCVGKSAFPVIEIWINQLKICRLDTSKTPHPRFDRKKAAQVMGPSGKIGFQVHKGNGWPKGARVYWKDIRIRKLP